MPVNLLVDAPWSSRLSVVLSPLAELVCALHTAREVGHHPTSRGWVERFRTASNGDLLASGNRWGPLWDGLKARYFLPLAVAADADIDRELLALAQLPADLFVAMTAQALAGESDHRVVDLTQSGPGALMARMRLQSHSHVFLGEWLLRDPIGMQEALVEYLRQVVDGVFTEEWAAERGKLEEEGIRIRRLVAAEPMQVFEDLPQATVQPENGTVVFDVLYSAHLRLSQAPLILVPSVHVSPHMTIKRYPGFPFVIQYPVRGYESDYVTVAEARQRLNVMTDITRLTICRDIIRRPASTTELAQSLKMTIPQVSRHLRHLREAGLVTGSRAGSVVRYQLDLNAVRRIGIDLVNALLR